MQDLPEGFFVHASRIRPATLFSVSFAFAADRRLKKKKNTSFFFLFEFIGATQDTQEHLTSNCMLESPYE